MDDVTTCTSDGKAAAVVVVVVSFDRYSKGE